jgi:pyruvate/2-oxoglutarate dehydrogenase complex dihydrolipoamide dehydrogenase (E3) component
MPQSEHFDVVILGSGQGGKHLAWDLARSGKRVAVVERRWVGGSCPAVACMPSKNELWSARVAHVVRQAAEFGTLVGDVRTDMRRVLRRKQDMVEREIAIHLALYKESGAELIMGSGRFVAPKTIEVALNEGGARMLDGAEIVLNLGSHAAIPEIVGLEAARPLTHIEALELDAAPSHLIILGGGYVGVETAQTFRRFGSRVTIVESGPQLMGREDPDVAQEIEAILRNEGVEVVMNAHPQSVRGLCGDAVAVTARAGDVERKIEGSDLLVAVGRIPNTADVGLEKAGVELEARGFIRVDERLRTSAPGVWAIGECAGSPQFTHISVDDFRIVASAMAGGTRTTKDRPVPYVVFTDPSLARVGLSEVEAQQQSLPVRIARLPMSNVLRTEATDEKQGFMKAIVSASDDRILGFVMIGSEAGEVLAVVQTAMMAELPYTRLRDTVFSHLTMAEGLGFLFSNVPPRQNTA